MRNLSALKTLICSPFGSQMRFAGALLFLLGLSSSTALAQSQIQVRKALPGQTEGLQNARPLGFEENVSAAYKTSPGLPSTVSIGATQEGTITTVKIGEASNMFGTLAEECHPLAVLNGFGTGGAGIISFTQRVNILTCGGTGFDNGRVSYVISADGGTTWNVGGGVNTSVGVAAPANHCFGIAQLNPTYLQAGRYPMTAVFDAGGNGNDADVAVVYVGSSRGDDNPRVWDGSTNSFVSGAATASPTLTQEDYLFSTEINSIAYSLVERVPGEFWYTSTDPDIDEISAFKGTYNSTTNKIDWVLAHQFTPNLFTGFDGTGRYSAPQISFSPNGMNGTIAFLGDLVGGQDTVYSPIFVESTDGGQTWGSPVEFNMGDFFQLSDTLRSFGILLTDTSGMVVDTLLPTGKATTGFSGDLTVDANGNPHFFAVVGVASTTTTQGLGTSTPQAGYSIFSGFYLAVMDFTKDSFGDWNMLYVSTQNVFRGYTGDFSDPNDALTLDPHMQVGRSADGMKVHFAWTDTDTTGNWSPTADPNGGTTNNNNAPDLRVRSFDAVNYTMSPRQIPTLGDPTWEGRVLIPKMSHVSRDVGSDHHLPVVFADLDAGKTLSTTSYYYITDVSVNDADYTEPALLFYNCKQDPMANSINVVNPGCGANDGELSLTINGGNAPHTVLWSNGATTPSITGLASGIYTVTVTDSLNCVDQQEFTLNSANAPVISTTGIADISCFGAGDGTATVSVTGGAGTETFTWSNGETTATALGLPVGTSTVQVTDVNGCTAFESVTINEPTAISLTASKVDVSCFDAGDGSATAAATGGTGMLSYSWDNGMTAASIMSLGSGTYNVTVTDANGCTTNQSVVVSEPSAIAANLTATPNIGSQASPTGFASATISGGTLPYTYSWYGNGYSGDRTRNFINGVCEGTFYVSVTDGKNCTYLDSVVVPLGQGAVGCFGADGIEEELAAGITTMQLLPNPNNGSFHLRLELDRPEDLRIEVINMNGKVVARELVTKALVHDQAFQLNGIASGIYLVQVTTLRGTAAQKIVIQ